MFFLAFFLAGQKQPENQSQSRLQGERAISMDRKEIMRHERSRVLQHPAAAAKTATSCGIIIIIFLIFIIIFFFRCAPRQNNASATGGGGRAWLKILQRITQIRHKKCIYTCTTHTDTHTRAHTHLHMQLVVNWSSQERQSRKPLLC